MSILMVQPRQRVARQRVTQSFSPDSETLFPPLGDEDGAEGRMIIEAEIGGHFIHRIYVDGGSSSEILYEHCFYRMHPEVKSQMVPAIAPLIGFSKEIIWTMAQISLPVKIGDTKHSTLTEHLRQKKKSQAPKRNKAIQEEFERLVEADIMKEVHYHSLLSNPNAGATYQRLVDKAFQKQISRNLEVYVDDLVIKSRTEQEIIRDIEETFKTLREINMKLNLKKCTFEVEEGMFLGYMVNTRGIKVYSDKVEAVLSLPSPKCLKDMQRLNGKLTSLNRFLSKSAD
ncbi:reverse transcriptase domain-containing protein [Tanacetum coccineum]|uniref:Reverse transcriptase domain-containing protein n=1 Tax=Tanacetum coccineum TaxID=301880 RepID=A0ABQ4YEL7_9ASTR